MDPPAKRGFTPIKYKRKVMVTYELLLSKEYRSLSAIERDVFTIFLYKRQFSNKKKTGKPRNLKNNGDIEFTESEAAQKWGIKTVTFRRSIRKLKDLRMIRVAHKGFGLYHDVNKYELLGIFDGVCR